MGIRRADVRWRPTELTAHSLRTFARAVRDELQHTGIGALDLAPWLSDEAVDWSDRVTDQFHHMGTARMHDSPRLGVTNPDCGVHGVANLFVGGSAVFPTGGHSNPTLTLIALCMRLSDKLKRDLAC